LDQKFLKTTDSNSGGFFYIAY